MTDPSDLQALVDALAADLGCPVLIEDAQHQPLWWSAQEAPDEVRMRTIMRRMVAPEARAMVRRLQLARGPQKAGGPRWADRVSGTRPLWAGPECPLRRIPSGWE